LSIYIFLKDKRSAASEEIKYLQNI